MLKYNMTKKNNFSLILIINFIIFIILWIFVELIYFGYKNYNTVQCNPSWILYNYCPNIKYEKVNNLEDGGDIIQISVDENGSRVSNKNFDIINKAKVFIIGDSFVQADEISYEKTVYGKLNSLEQFSTYSLGYSSWNPIQYFDAVKKINKLDSEYIIFLFANDVHPGYIRSVYGEINSEKNFKNRLSHLLCYKILKFLRDQFNVIDDEKVIHEQLGFFSNKFTISEINNCDPLNRIKNSSYSKKLGFDYIVYSKSYNCWPEKHKIAYEAFAKIIRQINHHIKNKLHSNISYIWVPAGWAFKDQNSMGRMNSRYFFSNDIEITQQGLTNKFKSDFNDYEIIDMELILHNKLNNCKLRCKDKYYYPLDGHWKPDTHEILSHELIKKICPITSSC